MYKYILLISLLILPLISCSGNDKGKNVKRVEIVLKDNEEHKENIEIKDYNEDKLKKLALSSLK